MGRKEPEKPERLRPPKLARYSRECPGPNGIAEVAFPQEFILNNDPLTMEEILENVFSNLDGEDLESCKKVNRLWKSVIGKHHARHYKVTLKTYEDDLIDGKEIYANIRKLYWSRKHSPRQRYTFPDALDLLLKKSSKEQKFAINLQIKTRGAYDDDTFRDFLSKIGCFVHTFSPRAEYETLGTFCTYLTRDFPNLHHLDLSATEFKDSGPPLGSSFNKQENLLKEVKKITFGIGFSSRFKLSEDVEFLLELIPNVEEIREFPLLLVDVLISRGKSNFLMSANFSVDPDDLEWDETYDELEDSEPYKIALEKFTQLAPKLRSFSFGEGGELRGQNDSRYIWPENIFYHPTVKTSVCKILESSHKSLETLKISPPGDFDFSSISPMTSLRKVELVDTNYLSLNEIPPYFGQQIKELSLNEVETVEPTRIRALGSLFGSVKYFQFLLNDLEEPVFPIMADIWPEMEVMSFKIGDDSAWTSTKKTFDSFLTGIPDDTLTQLKDPIGRAKFSREEMSSFYKNSTLRKLSKLKKLVFDVGFLRSLCQEDLVKKIRTITCLSKEFGFAFLSPAFVLVIRRLPLGCIEDLKDALPDVVRLEI